MPCRDVAVLGDAVTPLLTKVEQVVARLHSLGVQLPSEAAWRQIVGGSIAAGISSKTSTDKHHLLNELKRLHKQRLKGAPSFPGFIIDYPATPALLPKWLHESAYGD